MLLSPPGYCGAAAIPEAEVGGANLSTAASPDRFAVLIGRVALAAAKDGVGLSPVSVISHCVQAKPPVTPTDRSNQP